MNLFSRPLLALAAALALSAAAHADVVQIAVAANFTAPAKALAEVLAKTTGHDSFFNDTATTEIYTPSLRDALPILFMEGPLGVKQAE